MKTVRDGGAVPPPLGVPLPAQLGGITVTYHAAALGKSKPVASNSTSAGRQLNRRVVITLG